MNPDLRVDPDELDARAGRLHDVAGRIRLAAVAGRPLDLAAYGVVGQLFALAAAQAADSGSATVARVARRAGAHADGMRAAAADYRQLERELAAGIGAVR